MKRNDFFKRLGFGAAAVVVAPKILASHYEEVDKPVHAMKGVDIKVHLTKSNEVVFFNSSFEGVQTRETPSGQIVRGFLTPEGIFRIRSASGIYYKQLEIPFVKEGVSMEVYLIEDNI